MDDLISRQAAIDKLKREEKIFYSPTGLRYLIGAIRDLPSAQTQDIARDIATIIENEKDMRVVLKQPRWIPCSERLPDSWNERYLVSLAWGGVGTMEYKSTGFHNYGSFSPVPIETVTAWMPLPEPYKGEES